MGKPVSYLLSSPYPPPTPTTGAMTTRWVFLEIHQSNGSDSHSWQNGKSCRILVYRQWYIQYTHYCSTPMFEAVPIMPAC